MSIAERELEAVEERVVLDDLEAGELAVEYDAAEPEEVLEWAFGRFGRRVALFSSFQADGVALIDMLSAIKVMAPVAPEKTKPP